MERSGRFDILIHVRPWQALLFDPEPLIDLATGELGAAGITLSIKAPESQDAIALDPAGELLAVRLAAGVLYQPNPQGYASTRLRPVVSPTLKNRQPVARIADLCRQRSQVLRLRISALGDAALAARHGEAVGCNAISLSAGSYLCPSNPDVLEFVRCQLLDIEEQFEPDLIEIENFTWPDRYQAGPGTATCWPAQPGPVESALMVLCFCPSCLQQAVLAGVDGASARRSVQVHLMRWLRSERAYTGTMENLLAEDSILAGYIACQHQALLQAVQLWTLAVPNVSLVVAREGTAMHHGPAGATAPPASDESDAIHHAGRSGSPWNPSFEELAEIAPRLTLLVAPDASAHGCTCARQIDPACHAPLEAAIDATSPSFASGPDIVRCLSDLARAGAAGIELEHGLHVSPSRRPFIRQAIRAARRERNC